MWPNFAPAAPALSKLSVKPQSHVFPDSNLSFGATHTRMRGHVEAGATQTKSSDVCVALHLKPNDKCCYDHKLFLSRSESVGVKTLKWSSSKIVAHFSSYPQMMSYLGCFEIGSAVWAGLMVLLISVNVCLQLHESLFFWELVWQRAGILIGFQFICLRLTGQWWCTGQNPLVQNWWWWKTCN